METLGFYSGCVVDASAIPIGPTKTETSEKTMHTRM